MTKGVPVRGNTGLTSGGPQDVKEYYVREALSDLFGPLPYHHADDYARFASRNNEKRVADIVKIVNGRTFVVAWYANGRKILGGRIAEENSETSLPP